ncbi:hypothetical protein ILYODFUR_000355 [Ilyodon furcidens]|uniref:Uncharacterized protein n=1 Tax=Ilyodon furcidens TaxID=33524 RepID=A0ABV0THW1_9TELE
MKPTEMVGVGGSAGPQGRVVKVETRSPAVGEDDYRKTAQLDSMKPVEDELEHWLSDIAGTVCEDLL